MLSYRRIFVSVLLVALTVYVLQSSIKKLSMLNLESHKAPYACLETEALTKGLSDSALLEKASDNANSLPGHTGSGIPKLFRNLLKTKSVILDDANSFNGAHAAVDELEKECGWDSVTSSFRNVSCMDVFNFETNERDVLNSERIADLVDVVVQSIGDLNFLEEWRKFIEPLHIIIIHNGDASKVLRIPTWADYELYNRHDIESYIDRNRSWVFSSRDFSIRNLGFIVSRKRYIYTLDENCLPATDAQGKRINAIAEHVRNLLRPSTPYYFNTLFDPYRPGSDFVRGYPFSLRNGVPTVISHGLWLNLPDYDAPTQLLKMKERNKRMHDVVLTVPHGTFYPMSSLNVAFDRKLIGPAFMQGFMGDDQPWARYDDMFAGWCSKVILDHLGFGAKHGSPYIYYNKVSNPFTNLKSEYNWVWLQEDLISFFRQVRLSETATDAASAYRELSLLIEQHFGSVHPYFKRVAKGMRVWLDVLREYNSGRLTFKPSRSSQLDRRSDSSRGSANSTKANKDPDCLTYAERYGQCSKIHRMPLVEQRKIFHKASTGDATEAAILRLSNNEWPNDFWLNVCAFILETSADGTRIPVLLTNKPTIEHVPWEFRSLVRVQDDEIMKRILSEDTYISGYSHGDQLAAMWLLLDRPDLTFVWVFENDIRYSGHYGKLLARSRRWSFENPGVNASTMPNNTDAHVIIFAPPFYDREWHFNNNRNFFRGEFIKYYNSQSFFGIFIPLFGMSRFMATKLIEQNRLGNSHASLEGNIPGTVLMVSEQTGVTAKVSYFSCNSAIYYTSKKQNDVRMYKPWKDGETFTKEHFAPSSLDLPRSKLWHPHPLGVTFEGQRCLKDYLMHPVKLA